MKSPLQTNWTDSSSFEGFEIYKGFSKLTFNTIIALVNETMSQVKFFLSDDLSSSSRFKEVSLIQLMLLILLISWLNKIVTLPLLVISVIWALRVLLILSFLLSIPKCSKDNVVFSMIEVLLWSCLITPTLGKTVMLSGYFLVLPH